MATGLLQPTTQILYKDTKTPDVFGNGYLRMRAGGGDVITAVMNICRGEYNDGTVPQH